MEDLGPAAAAMTGESACADQETAAYQIHQINNNHNYKGRGSDTASKDACPHIKTPVKHIIVYNII